MVGVPLHPSHCWPFVAIALVGFFASHHMIGMLLHYFAELVGVPRRILVGERWELVNAPPPPPPPAVAETATPAPQATPLGGGGCAEDRLKQD